MLYTYSISSFNLNVAILFFVGCNCTIKYQVVDTGFEPEHVPFVDTFTWLGERFEKRPTQSDKILYTRRKRDVTDEIDEDSMTFGDEIDLGVLVLAEKISTINEYLTGPPRTPFHFPRQKFVIVITNADEPQFTTITSNVLKKLWQDYGIASAILITPCNNDVNIFVYFRLKFKFN